MITISRKTGEVLFATDTPQEKKDEAWEHIFDAYIKKHPEVLGGFSNDDESVNSPGLKA